MRNRIKLEARNAFDRVEQRVLMEMSIDGGQSWIRVSGQDAQAGLIVQPGTEPIVRFRKEGLFAVVRGLRSTAAGLEYGPRSEGDAVLQWKGNSGNERNYLLVAWVNLFREASLTAHQWKPVPSYKYWIFEFSGLQALKGSGSGFDRFAGALKTNVLQHDGSKGEMLFLETPDDAREPRLVAVYVPVGVDLSGPVQVHTFFLPEPKKIAATKSNPRPYPWDKYFGGRFDAYLVGSQKRLLHQHGLRGNNSLFVLPMPSHPDQARGVPYFSAIHSGVGLKRFLQSILVVLFRRRGPLPWPRLGRCAASGYSRGGSALTGLVNTTRGHEFDELKEIYALDSEPGSVKHVAAAAKQWLGAAERDRRLRIYVSGRYGKELGNYTPPFAAGPPRTSAGAKEWTTPTTTFFYSPASFWSQVRDEEYAAKGDCPYMAKGQKIDDHSSHTLIPLIMMTHALATSGFR